MSLAAAAVGLGYILYVYPRFSSPSPLHVLQLGFAQTNEVLPYFDQYLWVCHSMASYSPLHV